ncbi:Histidine kinase-, DNA gyrase B-, and HSP90-like ATPase [Dyadobacter soli]|uniref:Histidine kinase-, DNA gyrase B-, and HSP90-like ATPase n=1 Tax=Dyadobacter soli TaxID=659014 RepID=A0A1G7SX78_9BACT|nr:histidine kinase [Dyadobacter soli]SDG27394.1 Histidine kinase-, DNA gyrase B-, and HSP90-like ATPase [Dyadobacter soli]
MKKLALLLFLLISAAARGQYNANNILAIKEIHDGVVCDSCIVTMAGSVSGSPQTVSFLTPNYDNQFLYTDASLTRELSVVDPSKFFVAMARFSLDFYPYGKVLARRGEPIPFMDYKDLQFKATVNGALKKDWTDITSLGRDPDYYIGLATVDFRHDIKDVATKPAEHYHAGKFELRLGDSLRVEFRNKNTLAQAHHFSITRVRSVPDYFNFVEFSGDKNFQEILNTEINKVRTEQGPQASHFQIAAGHSAFLRFSNHEQYYYFGQKPRNTGIEYAIGAPENWQRLGGEEDLKFTQGHSYIYLDRPKPGEAVKIFLRYKHQPESVHEITVDVSPTHAGWIDVALPIVAIIVIALLTIFILKQRHKMQLARLNRKQSEIENQLQLLSGQLNPHFLFNSLNAVQSLIRQNDPEAANQYITEVATFMRTIMDSGRKELVSLAEEISIEEKYIALEQKRKPFVYAVRNQCGNDLGTIDFPPLLLQPIIENSIRHGLAESVGEPALTVTIRCDATDLIVSITDNGIGFDTSVKSRGHGLSLTAKRIALINEKLPAMRIVVETKSSPGNGTTTEIRLLKWLS